MTFAQIKALKASQAAAAAAAAGSNTAVPRSPRSLHTIDTRSLSPRPERIAPEPSERELEEELKQVEAEHERVKAKLQNMEQNESKGRDQLQALQKDRVKVDELQKDVKYAELELQFAKERVAKVICAIFEGVACFVMFEQVYQQKHKQELLVRSTGGSGVGSEIKALQEQLAEETARGKALALQKEAAQEQIFKLQQAIEA